MKRHLCSKCKRAVTPFNADGARFEVEGIWMRATSPDAATPGQNAPSGQCPHCHGPTFCAETGAV